jgi:taurine dioxygenase
MGAVAQTSDRSTLSTVGLDSGVEVIELAWRTGLEIRGLDLTRPDSISDGTIQALMRLVSERCFLLFRGHMLNHDQHIAFTKRFGPLAKTGMLDRYAPPGYPDIYTVTNMKVNGERSETWETARQWHSDQSFMPVPALGSMLRCEIAPRLGGDTMFANMYLAYERLSAGIKKTLRTLRARHSPNSATSKAHANRKPYIGSVEATSGALHPVVRTHPVTGWKCLYVSEQMADQFEGWTIEESAPLLHYLNTFATQTAFVYRHHWRPGDLVFWDNRCTMHHAPADYDISQLDAPGNQRLMHRTTLAGSPPY